MGGQYLTSILLEFSEEDLSDTTPTWVDVTQDLITADWWAGVDSEGSDPDAGGATLVMRNRNRRWEPDYVAGEFYPNITYARRFRLTLDDAAGSPVQEGLWYVTDISIDYPLGTEFSVVTFICSDGVEVLAMDSLPLLDPPDADSYEDVVGFDEPWGYWRLGDPEGTKARANLVSVKTQKWVRRGGIYSRRKIKMRRGSRYSTRSETGAASGPAGFYKNNPALGADGLILGDGDTAVTFDGALSNYVEIEVDEESFQRNQLTIEAWVSYQTAGLNYVIVGGPIASGSDRSIFAMHLSGDDVTIATGAGTLETTGDQLTAGAIHHLVFTWDGVNGTIYVDGVAVATSSFVFAGGIEAMAASPRLYIARRRSGAAWVYSNTAGNLVTIDEVAIYEHALTAERVLAHTQAGAERGYPQQTAGARIADIATHALWSEASIQTTGRDVLPQMKSGQSKMSEIGEIAHAEGPRTMFFFNGIGDPVYLGHEWQATSSNYNTTQVTLGTLETEVSYEALDLDYDNEVYNEVTVSHVAGDPATAGDGTPPPRRENTEFTDVLLMEHNHVESLAAAVLAFYESPQLRPTRVTLNGADPTRLNHILRRDIGHQIRVKQRGEGGTPIDRITNIIGKRKGLTSDGHLTCEWTLGRGFNAADGFWHAGIVGFSEAGSTTVAA